MTDERAYDLGILRSSVVASVCRSSADATVWCYGSGGDVRGIMMKVKNIALLILLTLVVLTSACGGRDSTPADTGQENVDNIVDGANDSKCTMACLDRMNMPKAACEREAWLNQRPGLVECTCGKNVMAEVHSNAIEDCGAVSKAD